MSGETKVYAKQLGVELITEYQLNEIYLLLRTGNIVNDDYTGLMGIIISKLSRRLNLFEKSVNSYKKEPVKVEELTNKEELKNKLINIFEQANLLL